VRRIVVVGTSGSGKTALARGLAERLGYPHVELDALHWRPNWTSTPGDEFRDRVMRAVDGDAWVVDGNYSVVRDIIWNRADTIVWLDYALPVILWRLLSRTVRRVLTRQELWAGNRENLRLMFSRDSIFWWALHTYRKHRRTYAAVFSEPAHGHLTIVRLRSPRACAAWLSRYSTTR
jgi:adenylate kinase family enzyme